jgi:hypothetical protein
VETTKRRPEARIARQRCKPEGAVFGGKKVLSYEQEAILPGSDHARQVRFMVKKVHVQDQEARVAR